MIAESKCSSEEKTLTNKRRHIVIEQDENGLYPRLVFINTVNVLCPCCINKDNRTIDFHTPSLREDLGNDVIIGGIKLTPEDLTFDSETVDSKFNVLK